MPHYPKPFFRKPRGLWYVQLRGKQINLGPDREAAFQRYHELLAAPKEGPIVTDSSQVVALCDVFLEWVKKHRAAATYEWYRYRLQRFVSHYPELSISELKPYHVQQWVDGQDIRPTTQRNCIRAIKRAMKWSKQQGYITENPIAEMEAPSAERRETIVSEEEYFQILESIPDQAFRELITTTWETGCRPQESLRVETRHFDRKNKRWVFPQSESKTKKRVRVVYLTDTVADICGRLATKYPRGPLFRNANGKPWKKDAVQCSWRRVRIRLGRELMKENGIEISENEISQKIKKLCPFRGKGSKQTMKTPSELRCEAKRKLTEQAAIRLMPNYSLYALRHTWATRALLSGVDSLTVAQLLGHSNTGTLSKVYAHLSSAPDHLLDEVNRIAS